MEPSGSSGTTTGQWLVKVRECVNSGRMMKPEQVSLRSVITTSSLEQQQQQQQQLDVDAIAEVNLSWRCRELMARLASSIDSTSLLLVDNINDQSSAAGPSSGLITRARSLGHCRRWWSIANKRPPEIPINCRPA